MKTNKTTSRILCPHVPGIQRFSQSEPNRRVFRQWLLALLLSAAIVLPASLALGQGAPEAPVITVQPQTLILPQCPGPNGYGDITLTVEATGTPAPDYYWSAWCPPQFPNCGCILRPPQAGSSRLVLPNFTPDCAAGYFVVVSNAAGSVTSVVARLVVAPEVVFSDGRFPQPNSRFEVSSSRYVVLRPGLSPVELLISNLTLSLPGSGLELPAPGVAASLAYEVEASCLISRDGGTTFRSATCVGQITIIPTQADPAGGTLGQQWDFDIETLTLSGGTLPAGMALQKDKKRPGRESPTLASLGRINASRGADGSHHISSFFDIFTEVSLDSGKTWTACQDGSCRAILKPTTHEFSPPDDNFPPIGAELSQAADGKDNDCDGKAEPDAVHYALPAGGGVLSISNLTLQVHNGSAPFAPLSVGQELDLDCDAFLDVATASGVTRFSAPASLRVGVDHRASTTFQMEVLSLQISGGSLPSQFKLRESPSLPSRGKTSRRANADGTFSVSSFFDIFTEISLDGGSSWIPARSPTGVGMRSAVSLTPIEIFTPPNQVLLTCGEGSVVNYQVVAVGQDGPVVCTPPSGSVFPLGVTVVNCVASNNSGGIATSSFTITVKPALYPDRWPCTWLTGLGIPYEVVGGATTAIAPDQALSRAHHAAVLLGSGDLAAMDPDSPAISIFPQAGKPNSGIFLHPGPAQGIAFTTLLDFTAPEGAGFDLFLPPDPKHPNDPPILSVRVKNPGYNVKMNKRFADDPDSTMRVLAVNTNGQVLKPLTFTPKEADAMGVFNIIPQPGVSNCHITVEINLQNGSVSVEFPGPIVPNALRQGWDGSIYGPDRPIKKPTSRVTLIPPVPIGSPPITDLYLCASGVSELPVQHPTLTALGKRWGDGHVTLMKAYDDGVEARALDNGGGVHVDLGGAASFRLLSSHFENGGIPNPEQLIRIGPFALTNRPSPPPIELRLASGPAGVDCFPDFSTLGTSNYTQQLWSKGALAHEVTHVLGVGGAPACTLGHWPGVLGCPGVGVLSLSDPVPFTVAWSDGSSDTGDELRIIPELPPGVEGPSSFDRLEIVGSADVTWRFGSLQVNPAPGILPLRILCPDNIEVGATDASGAAVSFFPTVVYGDCPLLPLADITCNPPSGSVFPIGTTTVTCAGQNGCGEQITCSFTVTVTGLPVFTLQPASIIALLGQPARISAEVSSGGSAMYLWSIFCPPTRPDWPFCGCLSTSIWRPLCPGCPPPFVDFQNVTAQCGGDYFLVVSNAAGMVTSRVATVTVALPPLDHFFPTNQLPPAGGVYLGQLQPPVAFASGIVIRNMRLHRSAPGFPPPDSGTTNVNHFGSQVDMEVSLDGGSSFAPHTAPASVTVSIWPGIVPGSSTMFDTEMLQLDIFGGTLPPGMMLRESPTRPSTGQTTVRPAPGGYMISSFFDVFTEVSLDGGQTWSPAIGSERLTLGSDAALLPAVHEPTSLFPPPNALFASVQGPYQLMPRLMLRSLRTHFFSQSQSPSSTAPTMVSCDAQLDLDISTDSGASFQVVRCPSPMAMQLTPASGGENPLFETEMLALSCTVPGTAVMIRESPTEPSRGQTELRIQPDGTYLISSFFDVFTEVSLDGGQTWIPAACGPIRLELQDRAPEYVFPTPNLPPPPAQYVGDQPLHQAYANGVVLSNVIYKQFSQSQPPPPLGESSSQSFDSQAECDLVMGGIVTHVTAPAAVTVRVSSSVDNGVTRFFDTEMLALNIQGGGLPAGMMLRESPSKASLGRTSVRVAAGGAYRISSFFDIFTEISLDGGQTWSPSVSGPGSVDLFMDQASGDCVTFAGLVHCPLGLASVTVNTNRLIVSNLGSSGLDGVEIKWPSALAGLEVHWDNPDLNDKLPAGAYVRQDVIGSAIGVANSSLGHVTVLKSAMSNYVISADFSPVGAKTYTVRAYLHGVLIGLSRGLAGAELARTTSAGLSGDFEVKCCPWEMTISVDWGNSATSLQLNGAVLACDHLYITPEDVSYEGPPTAVQITASQVPSLTFTAENQSVLYGGLSHTSVGIAAVAVNSNRLVVSNLGSSGQDGVEIKWRPSSQWDAHWLDLDPNSLAPVGAMLRCTTFGSIGGVGGQALGGGAVTKTSLDSYAITAGFLPIGSSSFTVQVYSGSNLVGQAFGHGGDIGSSRIWPRDIHVSCCPFRMELTWNGGGGSGGTLLTVSGSPPITGDRLVIIPENSQPVDFPSSVQLLASGIPSITIVDESIILVKPVISTGFSSGNFSISWPGGGVLQQSADFIIWTDVPDAISPFKVTPLDTRMFYRVTQ